MISEPYQLLLDVDTTIEQCVAKKHPDCVFSTWKYIQFFCGNTPNCKFRNDLKINILHFFSPVTLIFITHLDFFECFCEVTDMASRFLPLLDLLYDVMVRQTYWAKRARRASDVSVAPLFVANISVK